jgi:DNA polymerase I-like protein with 3'-5' exonuclease and polymerase domains
MNSPIQGTAWEILALAQLYIELHRPEGIAVQLHVHDELALLARDDLVDAAGFLLRDAFHYAYGQVFPGIPSTGLMDIGAGRTWPDAAHDKSIRPEWSL